jgi:hypothetical protein
VPQADGMLPDERPSPEQMEIYRKMSGAERLQQAEKLYWMAREIKRAGVRYLHPEWTEEQVEQEVRRIFLYARS